MNKTGILIIFILFQSCRNNSIDWYSYTSVGQSIYQAVANCDSLSIKNNFFNKKDKYLNSFKLIHSVTVYFYIQVRKIASSS